MYEEEEDIQVMRAANATSSLNRSQNFKKNHCEFIEALAKVQEELKPVLANKKATYTTRGAGSFSNKYASIDQMVERVCKLFNKNGFAITQGITTLSTGHSVYRAELLYKNGYSKYWDIDLNLLFKINSLHDLGSLCTYLKRYTLGFFGAVVIKEKEDDDGNSAQKSMETKNLKINKEKIKAVKQGKIKTCSLNNIEGDMSSSPTPGKIEDLIAEGVEPIMS